MTASVFIAAAVAVPVAGASAAGSTSFTVDPARRGSTVTTLSNTLTSWAYRDDWTSAAEGQPSNYFATNYPSITTADLFSATGGGYTSKAETLTYLASNMTGGSVTALFQTSVEPASDLKFWVTTTQGDRQVTSVAESDTLIAGNAWTKRVYTLSAIPSGSTAFRIAFPTGGANAYNPQLGSVSITAATNITDTLDDWSKVSDHTKGLAFDTANAGVLGDTSRLMRTVKDQYTPAESITYRSTGMSAIQATALFSSSQENIDDLTFFASPDNATWTQLVNWTNVDSPINSGLWTKRVYSLSSLPSGTNFVRVTFPTGGLNSWNPQLAKVVVTGGSSYTDDLSDWGASYYHTSGLSFDTQNAAALGDASRAQRTNNYDGFPGATTTRDLFKNPQDRNTLTDYDFSSLITAVHNIIGQGLTPKIRLANVPMKFTAVPVVGAFGTNIRPPDDYDAYYAYIKAIADAMVAEFGIAQVKTWTWGMTPEIENSSWFEAADGTAASTETAFFRLYDYTVAALQASLGAANVKVGVHMMNQTDGLWNPADFIDHVASGTNYKTGATGTAINYIDFSYYEGSPGNTGQLETSAGGARSLAVSIERIRARALLDGLTGLTYGVAEGGIGFDQDSRFISNNILGSSYEGSFDALVFKKLNDLGIRDWSRWALNTEKIWGGVDGVSSHLDNLAQKMVGDARADVARSGSASDPSNIVDSMAGYNPATNKIHVMEFNHNPSPSASGAESVSLTVKNIAPASGSSVTVTKWVVDDTHANFWPTWSADRASHGVSNVTYLGWSPQSLTVPSLMTVQADKDYWYSRVPTYRSLAALSSTSTTVVPSGGQISLSDTVAQHGVVFYEISNATVVGSPTSTPTTLTDNLDNWYLANTHTAGLSFDTSNASALGDTSRAMRTTRTDPQSIDYRKLGATSATVTGLFGTDQETIADFTFFTSADGLTWSAYAGASHADSLINSGNWTKRVYSLAALPPGTNYLRVVFPTGGLNSWNPQLGQVTVTG
ncbi:hypothetical protein IT072_20455 [Leifsonia sp. ZF2019]|uniref:GH39 family glycosyl hydrolase n=1 Tax=Leifsonia sp. ZF2019 TaxID=2781978 RepID=UPI001CBD62C1|nr:hypothetical protein [Leifsonia sp. ZF2019]UAJ79518.1 hypothetical protein IT072_20455 [Leifsonia sp. ZF2019]